MYRSVFLELPFWSYLSLVVIHLTIINLVITEQIEIFFLFINIKKV